MATEVPRTLGTSDLLLPGKALDGTGTVGSPGYEQIFFSFKYSIEELLSYDLKCLLVLSHFDLEEKKAISARQSMEHQTTVALEWSVFPIVALAWLGGIDLHEYCMMNKTLTKQATPMRFINRQAIWTLDAGGQDIRKSGLKLKFDLSKLMTACHLVHRRNAVNSTRNWETKVGKLYQSILFCSILHPQMATKLCSSNNNALLSSDINARLNVKGDNVARMMMLPNIGIYH
ncbi:hypothetical protein L218DRAFT_947649 [Marasmius fiardii PR-910]|nr:hypothetical protein L218DRAFT_947649 [Marasmius fiardii PR-910]